MERKQLAAGVQKARDAVKAVEASGPAAKNRVEAAACGEPAAGFGSPPIPASSIDPKPLEQILGGSGQAHDGMVKFVFGRKTSMHGAE